MTLPDLALLHHFGNEKTLLEKRAGFGELAARLTVGMLEANRGANNQAREQRLKAQAEAMNAAFREVQSEKMAPVEGSMRHSRMPLILMALRQGGGDTGLGMSVAGSPHFMSGDDVPLGMDEGMVRMASAIGQDLAIYSFDKEAGIGAVGMGLGSLLKGTQKGLGAAIGGMGKGLGAGLGRMGSAVAGAPGAMKNFAVGKLQGAGNAAGGMLQGAKNKLQGAVNNVGTSLQRTGQKVQGRLETFGESMAARGAGQSPAQKPFSQMSSAQQSTAAQDRLARIQQKGITPGGKLQAPGQAAPAGGAPNPAAAAAPAAAAGAGAAEGGFDLQKAWDRTGLSEGRWKTKLPMLAAGAAGMYGLYAGAKKGFEILGRESQPYTYGNSAQPAYGVNEYGTPDRRLPFGG